MTNRINSIKIKAIKAIVNFDNLMNLKDLSH